MVTADATSMYTKIETEHGLEVFRQFLEELQEEGKLPPSFNIEIIVEVIALVMHWSLFECKDCYLKHLASMAMGTTVAVLLAIRYHSWEDKEVLIPQYSHGNKMSLLSRFIDDIFVVVLFGGDDGLNRNPAIRSVSSWVKNQFFMPIITQALPADQLKL